MKRNDVTKILKTDQLVTKNDIAVHGILVGKIVRLTFSYEIFFWCSGELISYEW